MKSKWMVLFFSIYGVSTLFSMAAMSVGAFWLVCALWVIQEGGPRAFFEQLKSEFRFSASRIYFLASFVLMLACAASLVAASFFPLAYGEGRVEVHFLKDMAKCWYLFWPLVLVAGLRRLSTDSQRTILRAWLVAFGVLSVVGIFQYFTGWPRPQGIPGFEPRYHANLFLGHHLSVANIFIFPFFAALDLSLKKTAEKPFLLPRWFLLSCATVGVLTLFLTFSRMVWVALPVGLLVLVLFSLPRRVGAGLFVALVLAFAGISQVDFVQKRWQHGMGVGERYSLWSANYAFFKERPLTGAGWHHNLELSGYYLKKKHGVSNVFSGHAHNNFLEMLGGTGLFGLGAWFLWCGVIFWFLWRVQKQETPAVFFAKGLFCAWIVFHLNGLTQVNFWESKVLHQIMWVTALLLLWVSPDRGRPLQVEEGVS